jgi:Transcriptional regulator PadR-like family
VVSAAIPACAKGYTGYTYSVCSIAGAVRERPTCPACPPQRGPKYGLRLQNEFESRTGEVWPLNVGQVYTTLQRLERDGLVASNGDGERSRKRYKITSAGSHELAGWLRTPP